MIKTKRSHIFHMICMWVKDVNMSASKEIYKSDFMSIESTLHVSKVSTFKVSNMFLENKMSKFG